MLEKLFEDIDFQNDEFWIAKEYFNSVYSQNKFFEILPLLVKRVGYVINEDYCIFPDPKSSDSIEKFDGVKFGIFDKEIVISDKDFYFFLAVACSHYVKINPSDRDRVVAILAPCSAGNIFINQA